MGKMRRASSIKSSGVAIQSGCTCCASNISKSTGTYMTGGKMLQCFEKIIDYLIRTSTNR